MGENAAGAAARPRARPRRAEYWPGGADDALAGTGGPENPVCKRDLTSLQGAVAQLQATQEAEARHGRGRHSDQYAQHTAGIIKHLGASLGHAAKRFEDLLEARRDTLAAQQGRRAQFTTTAAPAGDGGWGASAAQQQPGGVQAQSQMYGNSSLYYEDRANAVENIESTIVELGGIFAQLAEMVNEQETLVERIDDEVQSAVTSSERAQAELLRYLSRVSSNRGMVIKIFLVLMTAIIVYVVLLS